MSDLPAGWADVDFGAIADIKLGKMLDKAKNKGEPTPYLRNINVRWGNFDLSDILQMPMSPAERSTLSVRDGDILVCEGGEPGRSAVWQNGETDLTFQKALMRLRPRAGIAPHLLTAFLRWSYDAGNLNGHFTGTTIKHLPQGALAAVRFPLPPLSEQQRIVAKLDSLTGKSRRARDHLNHIPRLVEKYKQAILAAAFRGELLGLSTAKGGHPHQRCWDLPKSWRWVSFSDVVEISSNLRKPEEISELPHIAPDNVEAGTGRLLPYRTIGEDGVISAKHRFCAGQVIYSKIRPYLRKAVLVDFDGACSADMYPLTPSQNINAKYLLYWLISEPFAGFTFEHEGRSVLPKINQKGLSQTPLPLPPISDQLEIVRLVGSAFNWVDRLSADSTRGRKLIDRLDQAVLTKAFAGELVPQDPTDEPAGVLLEHIRAERAAAPMPKRGRKEAA